MLIFCQIVYYSYNDDARVHIVINALMFDSLFFCSSQCPFLILVTLTLLQNEIINSLSSDLNSDDYTEICTVYTITILFNIPSVALTF